MIGRLSDFLGALWVLLSLAIVSKGRMRSRYWLWRTHTAFPEGSPPGGWLGFVRSGLEYARWAWRIRRLR